jgi:hypothetical protein
MLVRDDLYWLALTTYQEARGEPYDGKLGVAWVIVNRTGVSSVSDTVLRKLQFSCWNGDSPTRSSLDVADDDPVWRDCFKAACAAYFELTADPTHGATHYVNRSVLPHPPPWFKATNVLATIGHHEFLRVA